MKSTGYTSTRNWSNTTWVSLIGSKGNQNNDAIMGAIASQITSLPVVNSIVYPDAGQRKHQSSASLAFVLEFPAQVASNAENVSIWWRHHGNCVWRCDCRLRERFDGFTKATNQSCHDDNFPPLMVLWIIMVQTYGVITDDKVGILTIIVLNILINIW